MASGTKMSFNAYQSGKLGTLPQASQKELEVSQDMHLKMSKKIAQLTKVIYALNTKNDEHEQVLQTLRDQHEEEIQTILADSHKKMQVYKNRLEEEFSHKETIEALHAKIEEYRQKHETMEEKFLAFKAKTLELQDKERESYANRLFDMSHEVLLAKKDFEEHLKMFSSWKERIVAEHSVTLAELNSKHQKEVEDIRSFQRNQDDTWLNQCAKIEEKFKSQIESLQTHVDELKHEKIALEDDYIGKLEKAQAFYEKELEALKNSQSEGHSKELENLRKEIDRLKIDFGANEKELRKQIDRLVRQLADTEDNLELSKKQVESLQAEISGRDSSSSELSKQIQELKQDLKQKSSSLQNIETELAGSKQHCSNLADELLKKSTILGELEAHKLQKEDIIKALQEELEKLKERLTRLDAERSSLQSHAQSLSLEQNSQLKNLRQALEDMTVEKETLKQWSDKQIQSLRDELVRQENALTKDFNRRVEDTFAKHTVALEGQKKTAAEELLMKENKLKEQHQTELQRVVHDKDNLQKELDRLKADLGSKLTSAEQEVTRLEKLVKDSEEGLGSASGQLENLKTAAAQLRSELDKTRNDLRISKASEVSLQPVEGTIETPMGRYTVDIEKDIQQPSNSFDSTPL
ncbi:protein FAM184A [Biomphalaria glabrata]